jgi:hypothetical protein
MSGAANETGASMTRRRGRLFVKYVLSLVGLVSVVLVVNGALDVWFSYREAKETQVRIQQEKAESAARRIAQFVEEIEHQIVAAMRDVGLTPFLPPVEAALAA